LPAPRSPGFGRAYRRPGDSALTVTINLPSGAYPYMILCADANGQSMIDNCKISNGVLNSDGEIVVVPTYTQT
jgi:hypothetical protein